MKSEKLRETIEYIDIPMYAIGMPLLQNSENPISRTIGGILVVGGIAVGTVDEIVRMSETSTRKPIGVPIVDMTINLVHYSIPAACRVVTGISLGLLSTAGFGSDNPELVKHTYDYSLTAAVPEVFRHVVYGSRDTLDDKIEQK